MEANTKFTKLRVCIRKAHSNLTKALVDIDVPRMTMAMSLRQLKRAIENSRVKIFNADNNLESALNHLRDYKELRESKERAQG